MDSTSSTTAGDIYGVRKLLFNWLDMPDPLPTRLGGRRPRFLPPGVALPMWVEGFRGYLVDSLGLLKRTVRKYVGKAYTVVSRVVSRLERPRPSTPDDLLNILEALR